MEIRIIGWDEFKKDIMRGVKSGFYPYIFFWLITFVSALFTIVTAHFIYKVDFFQVADVLLSFQICAIIVMVAIFGGVVLVRLYGFFRKKGKFSPLFMAVMSMFLYTLLIYSPIAALKIFCLFKGVHLADSEVYAGVASWINGVLSAPAGMLAGVITTMSKAEIKDMLGTITNLISVLTVVYGLIKFCGKVIKTVPAAVVSIAEA